MTVQAKVAAIMESTTSHLRTTLMLINLWWYYYPRRKLGTPYHQLLEFLSKQYDPGAMIICISK